MRLIDANEIENLFNAQVERGATDLFDAFEDALQDAQAVDAVPVMRCQNCKYYALWADGRAMNRCDKHECTMYDEDFCSYGERREG